MDQPYRIAVLGCAHPHIIDAVEVLRNSPRAEVAAVWDHDARRSARWSERLQAPMVSHEEEVFADDSIDAVVVMTETALHDPLVMNAAAARKHVFVEKPLATTAAAARRIADAVERSGVGFHTGYFLREVPAHAWLRSQVRKQAFGRVVRVRGRFAHLGALQGWFTEHPWVTEPQAAGFGGFGDLAIHLVDLLCWVLGDSPLAVSAHVDALSHPSPIDEYGEALVRFASGAIATIGAGWVEHDSDVSVEISGTCGHARADGGQLTRGHSVTPNDAPPTKRPTAAAALIRFLETLGRGVDPCLVPVALAAEHCRVLEAIYRAALSQRWEML